MSTTDDHSAAYRQAITWLMDRVNYERGQGGVPYVDRVLKLDRMQLLVHRLGDPHLSYPVIHVAGTKGKGSTSALIAAALRESGLRVGLYTSPHLTRVEERWMVDDQMATPAEMLDLIQMIQPITREFDDDAAARGDVGPTFFDLSTALGLLHFQRRGVDAAVLEVGLGGRLDSTNICQPAVSVITSISFDHTKQLGNTLAAIAREKAGIIKPGVPVVNGVVDPEPRDVIVQIARERAARLWQRGVDFDATYRPPATAADKSSIDYRSRITGTDIAVAGLSLAMPGAHQGVNAAIALATLDELTRQGWSIDQAGVRRALATVRVPARVEVLPTRRPIVIDSAHNPASAKALVETLAERWPKPWTLVLACSKDKDVPAIVDQLAGHFARIVVTKYVDNPRAMEPSTLAVLCRERNVQVVDEQPTPVAAWQHAVRITPPDELVVVSGSLFLAGELREVALATT